MRCRLSSLQPSSSIEASTGCRGSYGLFQPSVHILVPGIEPAGLLAGGQEVPQPRAAGLLAGVLRMGRPGIPAAAYRRHVRVLAVRPAHRPCANAAAEEALPDPAAHHPAGPAGRVQVHRLHPGQLEGAVRRTRGHPPVPAAHWHLVLHVPADQLRRGRVSRRRGAAAEVLEAAAVRQPVPPVHRRPHRPLRDHRRRDRRAPRNARRRVCGHPPLRRGPGEEGRPGKQLRLRSRLAAERRRGRAGLPARRHALAGHAVLHVPDTTSTSPAYSDMAIGMGPYAGLPLPGELRPPLHGMPP